MKLLRDINSRISRLAAKCWRLFLAIGQPKARFPNVPERLTAVLRDRMIEFEETGIVTSCTLRRPGT
jgi:hypothetical protein